MSSGSGPRAGDERCTRRALLRSSCLLLAALIAEPGCGASEAQPQRAPSGDLLETPPAGQLPGFATSRGARVADAYRYAASNRDLLHYIPCYCGCVTVGHESNYDCYVHAVGGDERVTYTNHGAG